MSFTELSTSPQTAFYLHSLVDQTSSVKNSNLASSAAKHQQTMHPVSRTSPYSTSHPIQVKTNESVYANAFQSNKPQQNSVYDSNLIINNYMHTSFSPVHNDYSGKNILPNEQPLNKVRHCLRIDKAEN